MFGSYTPEILTIVVSIPAWAIVTSPIWGTILIMKKVREK